MLDVVTVTLRFYELRTLKRFQKFVSTPTRPQGLAIISKIVFLKCAQNVNFVFEHFLIFYHAFNTSEQKILIIIYNTWTLDMN